MWNITVVAVGKVKESYFRDAIEEYAKRLGPYVKLAFQELKPEPFHGEGDKLKAKKVEGERLSAFLEKRPESYVIILDERGKKYSSPTFARHLEKISQPIIFVIGGSLGIDERIVEQYKNSISLSEMTFPHEMARMVLVEQIYRAVTILKEKEYHH